MFEAASPEAATDFLLESVPPTAVFFDQLDKAQQRRFRDELVDYFREFETPEGVREPRPYILILGTRR